MSEMEIYVHYENDESTDPVSTVGWKRGDPSLDYISSMLVVGITVRGSELLGWIRRNVTGIPMMAGAGEEEQEPMNCTNTDFSKPIPISPPEVKSLVWHGDDAKFLAGVIPGLLA